MTGFSQPPAPDGDPVEAEKAAAQPMQSDEPSHPTDGDLEHVDETDADDELPRGQYGPTLDVGND